MTATPSRETLIDTGDGHVIAICAVGERVHVDWCGPPHGEVTPDEARCLGWVLRGYARMIEPFGDPESDDGR